MKKENILKILHTKTTKKELDKWVNSQKMISIKEPLVAKVYAYFKDYDLAIEYIKEKKTKRQTNPQGRYNTRQTSEVVFQEYIKKIKDTHGIDIHEEANRTFEKTQAEKVATSVIREKRKMIDFFNINTGDIKEKIEDIRSSTDNNNDFVKTLKELELIYLASAKGKIVTKKTSRTVVFDVDDDGNIINPQTAKVEQKTNKNGDPIFTPYVGKHKYYEETQSHQPDSKSLAMVFVIRDYIEKYQNTISTTATDKQLYDRKVKYIKGIKKQKEDFQNRDYNIEIDREFLEADIE